VSLDDAAVAAATAAAEAEGISLSAWLSKVALEAARFEDGLRAVAEYEAEHGAFTEEEKRWADAVLDSHGVGLPPGTPRPPHPGPPPESLRDEGA
jgi:hypothetical protein